MAAPFIFMEVSKGLPSRIKIGRTSIPFHERCLRKQSTIHYRDNKVFCRLSFNADFIVDDVITERQFFDSNGKSAAIEQRYDPRYFFPVIDGNVQRLHKGL